MNASQIQYGTSSFSEIRKLNALYVDKTERIYDLVSSVNRRLFLSRPRRFGKTLLVDTLEQIFKGNKELFKGLDIYSKDYDWGVYPVMRINLSDCSADSKESLERYLVRLVKNIAKDFCIDLSDESLVKPEEYFSELFRFFKEKNQKIVVLVDEYDYPVISNITSPSADELREVLKNFYAVFKANTNLIHFEFLTGVTKLAYTTIFSGVNDVEDISDSEDFSDLLGYRQDELEKYFYDAIKLACSSKGTSKDQFLSKVKEWYDGYRFSNKDLTVYNPSSINKFFRNKFNFSIYWITTATPEFLVKLLKKDPSYSLENELSKRHFDFLARNTLVIPNYNLLNLLYQSGYITVSDYDSNSNTYKLDYPNKEVEGSFNIYLVEAILNVSEYALTSNVDAVVSSLKSNDMESFIKNLNITFKSVSSTPQKYHENAFQLAIVLLLKDMIPGFEVYSEQTGFSGRSDITVISKDRIYIMELKVDKKAIEGMNQIKEKQYYLPYLDDPRYSSKGISLLSISFNSKTKEVLDYLVEVIR